MERLHASCVVIDGHGILLRGPSGAGKSDLALRLIDQGGQLVSDDYTDIHVTDAHLMATAPPTIQGLLEVRGVGIVKLPRVEQVAVTALFDLVQGAEVERLPEAQTDHILGVAVCRYALVAFEASAPAKVRMVIKAQAERRFHSPKPVVTDRQ